MPFAHDNDAATIMMATMMIIIISCLAKNNNLANLRKALAKQIFEVEPALTLLVCPTM